uniref:Ig-like domain-containing protein n=1 Tax=Panagrolaimus sp. ES5 TaxID=591445 RepID=A0AC34GPA6_9BILA
MHGAELVNIVKNEQENKSLINDLTDLINEPLAAGITELTWLVGGMDTVLENPQLSYNLWMSTKIEDEHDKNLALQRKIDKHFELITVAATSSYPFLCSLLPLTRKTLLYEQALFPRGMPQIVEEPKLAYHYASRPDSYFVTVPCKAIGNPVPQIKWFKSGVEEIDLDASNTSYIISGGSLLIPINKESHESTTYHCSATNIYGTVRSPSTIVRSAFIESFRKSRLDVYPLNTKGTGTRIECQTPQHYPSGF